MSGLPVSLRLAVDARVPFPECAFAVHRQRDGYFIVVNRQSGERVGNCVFEDQEAALDFASSAEPLRVPDANVSVDGFIQTCVAKRGGVKITAAALYNFYADWCKRQGLKRAGPRELRQGLQAHGFTADRGRIITYRDLALTEDAAETRS